MFLDRLPCKMCMFVIALMQVPYSICEKNSGKFSPLIHFYFMQAKLKKTAFNAKVSNMYKCKYLGFRQSSILENFDILRWQRSSQHWLYMFDCTLVWLILLQQSQYLFIFLSWSDLGLLFFRSNFEERLFTEHRKHYNLSPWAAFSDAHIDNNEEIRMANECKRDRGKVSNETKK